MEIALILFVLILAASNGGNDVSKGIATLVGSGVTNYRRAVLWGTLWTVLGGLAAAFLSHELMRTFTGKGLLLAEVAQQPFLLSVGVGASVWVALATWTRMPVSTTHALVGALCGVGLLAGGIDGIHWIAMTKKVFLSLALGPLISLAALYMIFPLIQALLKSADKYCLCFSPKGATLSAGFASIQTVEDYKIGQTGESACRPGANTLSIGILEALHWLSSGLASFARGLNDTPKVLAIGIAATAVFAIPSFYAFTAAALAMGAGSLWAGRGVTKTLSEDVTKMSPLEGFGANLVTAILVGFASRFGLPVSTTHVSTGAILATGLRRDARAVRWGTVGSMLLAWILTLPSAAVISAVVYKILT